MKKIFFTFFIAILSFHMSAFAFSPKGSFFTTSNNTVVPSSPILFDQEYFAPIGGLYYNLGSGVFVLAKKGLYEVSYGFAQSDSNAAVALTVNGTEVAGSQLFGNLQGQMTSATIIIPLNAGDILSVINISTGPFNLQSFTNCITAFISILQV